MVKLPFELEPFGGNSAIAELHEPPELHETETLDKIRIPPF
jgi:hypothetical protein